MGIQSIPKNAIAVILAVGVATACGGSNNGSGGTKYNVAKSVGDLLTYSLDPTALTYSYQVLVPTQSSGSGALTPISGYGKYVYNTPDGATVVLFPNNFVMVESANALLAGVPALTANYGASDIAGFYNYVSLFRDGSTDYGTFSVDAAGTWQSWSGANGNVSPAPAASSAGTWKDQGNGVLSVYTAGTSAQTGSAMLLPSKVLVIDHEDAQSGITVGMKQSTLVSGQFDGTYVVLSSASGQASTTTVAGTTVTSQGGSAQTVTLNTPWTGFAQGPAETVGLCLPANDLIFGGGSDYIYTAIKQQ